MTQPGRDVNSVDEIVVDRDPAVLEAVIHDIELHSDVLFTWDYERSRTALVKLYEKAKTSQWNATTDLPWDTPVDWDKLATEASTQNQRFQVLRNYDDSPLAAWGEDEWRAFSVEMQTGVLSQFLHGEQGADPREVIAFLNAHPNPGQEMFQTMLFSKIVPNVRKLGLLDAGDGWLRTKFTELGIIQFEDGTDTSEEYGDLDAVAADRALRPRAHVRGT
jgi:hypothetical protein